jgi:polyphenol oxidase
MMLTSSILSALQNVRHGFSTRHGGVSKGAFSSLNLGRDTGDHPENIEENRARFLKLAGLGARLQLAQADQVHGVEIAVVDRGGVHGTADALMTSAENVGIAVRTADCAPLLVAALDESGKYAERVAAVHAGWRGAVAGIATRAIAALEVEPRRVAVAIGPSIGPAAFEVGEEVIEAARTSLGGAEPPFHYDASGRAHLDLRGLIIRQLLAIGIERGKIELVGGCTASEPELFFSHRRDRGKTGRHLSLISIVR